MDMADRISIDLTDLRERIENALPDPLWKELSLTRKIRILLQERLDEIEFQQKKGLLAASDERPDVEPVVKEITIAELVSKNLNKLKRSGVKNLKAIANGEVLPTKIDFCKIAAALGLSSEEQKDIWVRTYNSEML